MILVSPFQHIAHPRFLDLQYFDIVDCIDNVAKRLWKGGSSADVWFHE
jgi:hypothetical protein